MNEKLTVIDIGSNSIRNVIFETETNGRYYERLNVKEVARLSSYINGDRAISEEGISVLIDTLRQLIELNRCHSVQTVLPVATAAIRNATNSKDVLKRVKDELGISIRLLSDYEEAFYGYFAIVNSTFITDGYSVDIGGGSMEVTYFKNRKLEQFHSFPFGAVTLSRDFMNGEMMTKEERRELRNYLHEQFQQIEWLKPHGVPLIGVGGTARNLIRVEQSLTDFPLEGIHQYTMPSDSLHETVDYILSLSIKQLNRLDGLSKDRIDIIAPSIVAIDELAKYVNVPAFTLSNNGLREGLFYEHHLYQINKTLFTDVREESFRDFEVRYQVDRERKEHVYGIAKALYEGLVDLKLIKARPYEPDLLKSACRLAYIGEFIDHTNRSDLTFQLITTSDFKGLDHENRLALALVASFKSKRVLEQHIEPFPKWFDHKMIESLERLGAIIRLADALDVTERSAVQQLHLSKTEDVLQIELQGETHLRFEWQRGLRYKKHLERAIGTSIEIVIGGNHS